jgi:hypothetical protein
MCVTVAQNVFAFTVNAGVQHRGVSQTAEAQQQRAARNFGSSLFRRNQPRKDMISQGMRGAALADEVELTLTITPSRERNRHREASTRCSLGRRSS